MAKVHHDDSNSNPTHRHYLESLQEACGLASIVLDHEGRPVDLRLLAVNDAFATTAGLSPDGIAGKTVRELLTGASEDNSYRDALRSSRELAQGRLDEIEAIYRNAPVGLCVLDRDLRYVRINNQLAEINGYSPEEHIGRTVRELLPAIADTVEEPLREVLATGVPKLNMEVRGKTPASGGEERTWLESWLPIRDSSGEVTGVNLVADDITQLKNARAELLDLTATLEQRIRERTQSLQRRTNQLRRLAVQLIEAEERERKRVSTLLHEDLQQLLAAVRMDIHRALHALGDANSLVQADELLGEAIGRTRRLSHELSPAVLEHSDLSVALDWLTRQVGEQFGLAVRLETADFRRWESPSAKVFLFRAVQELLFNVVKHARILSAEVRVEDRDEEIVAAVTDRGRGFDPALLDANDGPVGLGLLGLRERVATIGGRLEIESAPGQGSTFRVAIPRQFGEVAGHTDSTSVVPSVSSDYSGSEDRDREVIRVVLAEDHRIIRQGLVSVIAEQPDIEIVGEAANGKEAIELVRRLHPDLVLMDVSMPIMDGIEASHEIGLEDPRPRIIALSMHEDEQIKAAMRRAGAEAFVSKADTSGSLLRAIYGIRDGDQGAVRSGVTQG